MHKKFLRACLIIACYAYETPANATLFPDQDLDGNPIPLSLRPLESKLEADRAKFNCTQKNFVILKAVYQSNTTRDDLKSKMLAAREAFMNAVSSLEEHSKAVGMVLKLCVKDTQKAFESDHANPVWRLICGGLVGTPTTVYRGLDEEFVRPMMGWVREHGGWKTASQMGTEIINVEESVVTVVKEESNKKQPQE
ncbi:MAG: hypothetical protein BGO76_06605 [Caedibacter sp. 38-128]|nr:hypothetical protein [Holosporales bacterium]OJX04603.1 MAG: hypothetical protein BGO76_06605 [Caedibacter sp. 38-128]